MTSILVLATAYVLPVSAEEQKSTAAFNPEMLKQFRTYDRNGPNFADILKAITAFTPTTPEQVDWCYLTCDNNIRPEIKMVAEKKLAALRDPALLTASRKHLFDDDKDVVKMVLKTIIATNDKAALSDLRKLETMQTQAAKRVYYNVRQTRAKLHDPELLKELTDPKKQTPDSTLAMYNRDLLKEYGDEGAKLLLNMEQNSKASQEQVNNYLSKIKDAKQVPDLLARYHDTSMFVSKERENGRKVAILKSLMRINSRECQPLFREILAKTEKELDDMGFYDISHMRMCVWKYNIQENERFQDQYIADLKKEDDIFAPYWPRGKDKTLEIVLIIAGKLKSSKKGYFAAEALKGLTGQQFQYAYPAKNDWALKEANRRSGKTSLTPEQIEAERQRDLKNMNVHLDKLKKLKDSGKMSQDHYDSYAKEKLDSIKNRYDDLLKSAQKPSEWEQGIPMDEAAQWLTNYYQQQRVKGDAVHESK